MKSELFRRKTDILLDAIYPKQCICCKELIESDEELCDRCFNEIERMNPIGRCKRCGLPKLHCECMLYVYHFEECIAPFYNAGHAKRGFYDFKFKRRSHYGVFFASEMAKSVKTEYIDKRFDAIVYVPLSSVSFLQRGFNQCKILAEHLVPLIDVPVIDKVLKKKFSFIPQHKRKRKKRFKSVRNLYSVVNKESVKDKNILLVDDIKTTGATLDECARQLLFEGAKSVCCLTALITDKKYKENKKVKLIDAKKILSRFGNKVG